MKEIHTLKIINDDAIDYSFKNTDRTSLNRLAAQKRDCDEIIIIQEADITVDDLMKAEKVSLFNAMIDFGEREVMRFLMDNFLCSNKSINLLAGHGILEFF